MIGTFIVSGLGDIYIVSQGFTPGEPAPHYPLDPSVITQGFLGYTGAVMVGGYHLDINAVPIDVYPDPFAATSTDTPDPFAATATSRVDPFAAMARPKGS